ncbi:MULTISPECIES: septal ring lytic transglycosylase RlpA family protein [unclassified Moritella]|uniref:septal ring lytic transglycosylase RlpA family protein n=1 Tax=unclassified Moritella TaxID=2637987 RepID=UPI001BABAC24|nr:MULTISPECIES: septal ring lytic transglycosylase RlpA family protein [unclassified Moritella]QUM85395.1 septal ring lytic transglycosylase RlpA family protein [Moritella sp. 28]QUM89627.1 septal ring lytic transglycosylase RlpA family protein [Moritella sp. 36]
MKKLSFIFTMLVLSILTACTSTSTSTSASPKTIAYSRSHDLVGQASWYGKRFHGKLTASGEKYNMRAYTAAHKTLPFGTVVRVINTANSKSVDVKINDRGPFVRGRVIDLSQKAFEKIGSTNQGVVPVRIEILDDSHTFRYKH